jgi:hypothetical protein
MHSWIPTYSKGKFDILYPKSEDVHVVDIAHSLSQKVRYNGHGDPFYSVAQHSVICATFAPTEFKRIALLHDANEAYLPDIPTPIKELIKGWRKLEEKIEAAIFPAFGLDVEIPPEVKEIDHRLVLDEAVELGFDIEDWLYNELYTPLGVSFTPVGWREAEMLFLAAFNHLFG